MKPCAVCLGDNCIDYYLPPLDLRFVGGNAVNVAVYLQLNRVSTSYVGAVGTDGPGKSIVNALSQQGIDVSFVRSLAGSTSQSDIRLNPTGDREFVNETAGPDGFYPLDEATLSFIHEHDLVHTTWLGGSENLLPGFKGQQSLVVSLDYGERYAQEFVEQTIEYVDVAFFSLPESQMSRAEILLHEMFERGPGLVVVTLGQEGSFAYDGNLYFQPAVTVEVVDTLGAGDAYIGTFLAHWLSDKKIPECMKHATDTAAKTCTHYGGWLNSEPSK